MGLGSNGAPAISNLKQQKAVTNGRYLDNPDPLLDNCKEVTEVYGMLRMLPEAASSFAHEVDRVFWVIFGLSAFFFLLIVAFLVYFVLRYRNNREVLPAFESIHLEIAWTVIPLILVIGIFYLGWKTFHLQRTVPREAFELQVNARQWLWEFRTPDGQVSVNRVVVPADTPVKVILSSSDVIHSFYVPAFRIKMDAVPGRYTYAWFEAKPGTYTVLCTEYCGTSHSGMLATLEVVPKEEYEKRKQQPLVVPATAVRDPVAWGREVYQTKGCNACHSLDGTAGVGPSFKGLFGKAVRLADGRTVTADENYIRTSILNPTADVVEGFNPVMPSYAGLLSEDEINALIAFIRSLR